MGRLDEYSDDEKATILGDKEAFMADATTAEERAAEQFWADAKLGERVRAMLAGNPPSNIRGILDDSAEFGHVEIAADIWAWLRRELLAEELPRPLPANAPEGGRGTVYGR